MSEREGTDGPAGLPAAQELLPCPCCGGEADADKDAYPHHYKVIAVFCRSCGLCVDDTTVRCGPGADLGDVWNRRTASGLEKENRRLREALTEISAFTADVPADEPLSHVHGVASAAIRSLKSPPANTEEGV
ncbi:MAG: Lar family restriction alleviation protein [Acetobacteraceae bacterium]